MNKLKFPSLFKNTTNINSTRSMTYQFIGKHIYVDAYGYQFKFELGKLWYRIIDTIEWLELDRFNGNYMGYTFNENDIHVIFEGYQDSSFIVDKLRIFIGVGEKIFYFPHENSMITLSTSDHKGLLMDKHKIIERNSRILTNTKKKYSKINFCKDAPKVDIPICFIKDPIALKNDIIDCGIVPGNFVIITLNRLILIPLN